MRVNKSVVLWLILSLACIAALHLLLNHRPHDDLTRSSNPSKRKLEVINAAESPGVKHATMNDIDPDVLKLSEHPDIDVRGKFQQQQIREMCRKHFFSREQRLPPNAPPHQLAYYRHLIFEDKREALFCFVPKIGCTNMKRLMLYMGGHLPMNTLDWPWVEDSIYLEPALKKASLLNNTLSMNSKVMRIRRYYKFMITRNPLERLASAYRNKIKPPLSHKQKNNFEEVTKRKILEEYRYREFQEWQERGGKFNISVTFSEFVQYFIETDVMVMNEHFRPSIDICHPCVTKFDFYGNFRLLSSDVKSLVKKLETESRFYKDISLHNSTEETSTKLQMYYSTLSHRVKMQLLGKLYDDLLFYYTLYPKDRHSHHQLLGLKDNVL